LDRLPPMRRRWLARTLGVAVDELGDLPAHLLPAWLRPTPGERRWPVAVAVVVAIVLQWLLPSRLALTPRWLLPGLEIALLVGLIILNPVRLTREVRAARVASLAMVAAVTAANGVSAGLLAYRLVHGTATDDPAVLLATGGAVYLTNIIAFALWYWELDRGGPFARAAARTAYPDFLFPQMSDPSTADPAWEPLFADYLYVSFTNTVAFSPTDTMPLTRWAKLLMMLQSVVALSLVALVLAHAVNVLK
jgi:uncharacterized membrane protein